MPAIPIIQHMMRQISPCRRKWQVSCMTGISTTGLQLRHSRKLSCASSIRFPKPSVANNCRHVSSVPAPYAVSVPPRRSGMNGIAPVRPACHVPVRSTVVDLLLSPAIVILSSTPVKCHANGLYAAGVLTVLQRLPNRYGHKRSTQYDVFSSLSTRQCGLTGSTLQLMPSFQCETWGACWLSQVP